MRNHVHMLVQCDEKLLSAFMRKVGAKYVYWYNRKYNRIGGLFQDRFKSEPVEDDSYFLTVLRYIHLNPLKAGICRTVSDYTESSYNEYIKPRAGQLIDIEFALSLLNKDQFEKYHNDGCQDECLEVQELKRISDSEAQKIFCNVSRCANASEFQALSREIRNRCLVQLKEKGLSVRQIERLTGINRGLVQKA